MKRLILADIKSFNNNGTQTGHYFSLVRNYMNLFENHCEVLAAGGPIYKTGFKNEQIMQLPCDFVHGQNIIKNKLAMFRNMRSLMKQTSTEDIIVIQMAGAVTTFLALALFGRKNSQIYSIQYDCEALDKPIKRFIYALAKRKVKGILCPSENIGKAYHRPYCVISDYIYAGDADLGGSIPYEERMFDYCMIGRITPEKGIVEAAQRLANTEYKVVIAGKPLTEELASRLSEIASSCSNILLHLDFISEEDYCNYIRQSRYSMMNYQGVYTNRSSGVVLDTLFLGTPVVGHRCMAMQFIEDENIGCLFEDISSFEPVLVSRKTKWKDAVNGISIYLKKHKGYRDKLLKFLTK